MHDKTIEWGYYSAEIKWVYDEWADLSHLGQPTDKRREYVIDRKEGVLLGEYVDEVITLPYSKIRGRKMVDDPYSRYGKSPDGATWEKAEELIEQRIHMLPYSISSVEEGFTVRWDGDKKEFWAEIDGYKILADNLGRTMGWHEYRYFDPEYIHSGKDHEVGEDEVRCAVEDWKRWEDYNNNYWSMMGCVVTIYKDGIEIAESSLWGIESDGGDEYIAEVERDVLREALHQAEITIPAEELLKEAEEA